MVRTSSPGFILLSPSFQDVNADIASRLAEEPEFVNAQYLVPINFDNLFSNISSVILYGGNLTYKIFELITFNRSPIILFSAIFLLRFLR